MPEIGRTDDLTGELKTADNLKDSSLRKRVSHREEPIQRQTDRPLEKRAV